MLKAAGASSVTGIDASHHAIAFARERYGVDAEFIEGSVTDLPALASGSFDLVVCSEVLEHLKEYGKEGRAIEEMRRIGRGGGVIVLGTPNSELLGSHGFSYDEIVALLERYFRNFRLFENALVPFGSKRKAWIKRQAAGRTGIIITEALDPSATVVPDDVAVELKQGRAPGIEQLGAVSIDTRLLHNTHSWTVVALND
jgi:SAM-dependent methyltransferase